MGSTSSNQLELTLGPRAQAGAPPPPPPPTGPLTMGGAGAPPPGPYTNASLAEETQRRYLNYALSVITSRALPDVRDGLKPVQRRILYSMLNELHLRPDTKPRKCAAIVGDVMGKFHPHGDTAIYDALARLAQPFTMRATLVDGRGNFGSPDGDAPAAMRYTEAKLAQVAMELLSELGKKTVHFRPNYDGSRFEPVVLPARFPHLLVNGSQGIAVGMATSIPPHNLTEVVDACIAMIDEPDIGVDGLLKHIRGPDFPSGGQLLSTRKELREVYAAGQGTLRLRGTYKEEETKKAQQIIVTSIPYSVERRTVVEKIAEVILGKKLPVLIDVRDESTDDCRIVLETKRGTDAQLVMSYLYKHTPLATNVQVNLTCLTPTENPDVCAPERVDLQRLLRHFLDFRMEVVTKRLEFDLAELRRRIHLLEGFAIIFDALDETIRIIRKSEGKQDAADKLMKRFGLDEEQVDAILELKLYRLAKLEILVIQEELEEKRKEASRLEKILKSESARWKLIRAELEELKAAYGDKRRTKVSAGVDEPEYDAEAFIVEEDALVLLSEQGWVKRQREVKDLSTSRVREGDSLCAVAAGSTRAAIAFFSNLGACYVMRINDVPASTGYGTPVQTLFKLEDRERIIAMLSFDPRVLAVPPPAEGAGEPEPPYAVAVSRGGMSLRFSLRAHAEPSTRAGRRFMRPESGDEVMFVSVATGEEKIACASVGGHALVCEVEEVSLLAGPGKGVTLMKLKGEDRLAGVALLTRENPYMILEHESGRSFDIGVRGSHVGSRGGKGAILFKRGNAVRIEKPALVVPNLSGGANSENGA